MPIHTDFGNLRRRLTQLEGLVTQPDPLLIILAERLLAHLEANTPVGATGKLREAMLRVRGPYDVPGGRAIGIGDMEMLIDPSVSAPRHTIKEFLIWYSKQREQERRERRREVSRLEAERVRLARTFEAKKIYEVRRQRLLRIRSVWQRIWKLQQEEATTTSAARRRQIAKEQIGLYERLRKLQED